MNKIILSIIIPAHNSEKTIIKLLMSINNSAFYHFREIETVIVDDFSRDKTIPIIKKLAPKLKNKTTVFCVDKHKGPAHTRNFGVKRAKGAYVLFLDSDVVLKKNTLNTAFKIAKKGTVKAFTGIWDWRQKTDKFFPQFKALRDWSYWILDRKKGFLYYLFSTRIAGIEKKLFNKIGRFNEDYDEPTVEDIELTYKIAAVAPIKFVTTLVIKHEFEDFWPIAIKYFKRSRDWIQLYMQRRKFDPVATSGNEAAKTLTIGFAFLSLFLFPITNSVFFLVDAAVFFILFMILEFRFLFFLKNKKGWIFMLQSIPTSIILYLIIELGTVYGLLLFLLQKVKRIK